MAGMALTPSRAMAAEDIRNLQSRARHACRASAGRTDLLELEREMLERTHDLADRLGRRRLGLPCQYDQPRHQGSSRREGATAIRPAGQKLRHSAPE